MSGCKSEPSSDAAAPVDSVAQNVALPAPDSGSLLVAVPDSTSSPQPSRIPRAKPDTGSIGAVAMPNAGIDSLEISLQQAIDQLDSMLIPAEKPAGKK
ncbi:MAG: hypothetical protein IPH75_03835 [bacterium]|nr:hypothetical protein [bacterium]